MRYFILVCTVMLLMWGHLFANGVAVVDGPTGTVFQLVDSHVVVEVDNQIAIVTTTQRFFNNLGYSSFPKYLFPLPEGASATQLRWFYEDEWHEAIISPVVQDSTPPGPGTEWSANLAEYMGETPLFYNMNETGVILGTYITIELTYVMLLPYEFGTVTFKYPNDYTLVQYSPVEVQELSFTLNSLRQIDSIEMTSHNADTLTNDGYVATVGVTLNDQIPNMDYVIEYGLSQDELGLFGFSTMLDSVPDTYGNGFFTFIAEPDPSDNVVIDKVFTLIIDRSGSMSGQKIIQARSAATYIVNHLNEGDMFNIVSFSSNITSFRDEHVEFTPDNQSDAIEYINSLSATGSTNISGAFGEAVPQFDVATDDTANIIIFFTDGEATTGITETQALVNYVSDLVDQTETNISIFNFGIGPHVNEQLLTLLAQDNNGLAQFLADNDLEEMITAFYMMIRNPVMINPEITYTPESVIEEAFPNPVPNLYQGRQLIVSGRYTQPTTIGISFSGTAFNQYVTYNYELELVDHADPERQFLPKIWAKQKIEHLMVQYYSYGEGSDEAEEIKQEIIAISIAYGVISDFTSFQGEVSIDDGGEGEGDDVDTGTDISAAPYQLLGNYPNPFNPSTAIRFQINRKMDEIVKIRIYNIKGQIVKVLALHVNGPGVYEIEWNGRDMQNKPVASGTYFYAIDFGDGVLTSKMLLLK